MGRRRDPERTCVGCRETSAKSGLVRVVASPDLGVRVDPTGSARGRGAYVHPDPGCVRLATERGGMARALRTGLDADGAARLRGEIEAMVRNA